MYIGPLEKRLPTERLALCPWGVLSITLPGEDSTVKREEEEVEGIEGRRKKRWRGMGRKKGWGAWGGGGDNGYQDIGCRA